MELLKVSLFVGAFWGILGFLGSGEKTWGGKLKFGFLAFLFWGGITLVTGGLFMYADDPFHFGGQRGIAAATLAWLPQGGWVVLALGAGGYGLYRFMKKKE